jgi:chromosome partitioning protein
VPTSKLVFALNRIGTEAEENDARRYIAEAGYETLPGSLPERAGYRMAQNAGYAVTETRFPPLNERADALIQALIDRIE